MLCHAISGSEILILGGLKEYAVVKTVSIFSIETNEMSQHGELEKGGTSETTRSCLSNDVIWLFKNSGEAEVYSIEAHFAEERKGNSFKEKWSILMK